MLDLLVPELASFIADADDDSMVWRLLTEVDRRTREKDAPLDDVVLWCALLLEPMSEACQSHGDRLRAAQDFLEPIVERLNLPRRIGDSVRHIVAMLPRLSGGKASRFKKSAVYPAALEVLSMRGQAPPHDRVDDESDYRSLGRKRRPRRGRRSKDG
jgi:poly(A) polymerase